MSFVRQKNRHRHGNMWKINWKQFRGSFINTSHRRRTQRDHHKRKYTVTCWCLMLKRDSNLHQIWEWWTNFTEKMPFYCLNIESCQCVKSLKSNFPLDSILKRWHTLVALLTAAVVLIRLVEWCLIFNRLENCEKKNVCEIFWFENILFRVSHPWILWRKSRGGTIGFQI